MPKSSIVYYNTFCKCVSCDVGMIENFRESEEDLSRHVFLYKCARCGAQVTVFRDCYLQLQSHRRWPDALQRRAQFVRGVGEQHPVRADEILDPRRRLVEAFGEAGHLVLAFDLHARAQIAGRQRLDALLLGRSRRRGRRCSKRSPMSSSGAGDAP